MSGIPMDWAMICSISDREKHMERLLTFGKWLTDGITKRSYLFGQTHGFNLEPKTVIYTTPDEVGEVKDAYETVHHEYSSVIFVLHVLDSRDSREYHLMKRLSEHNSLIRQGFLLETILNENSDVFRDIVFFGSIIQWISRRLHEIVCHKDSSIYSIRVGQPNEMPRHFVIHDGTNDLKDIVDSVLHNNLSFTDIESSLKVSGYDPSFNQYDIAKLFFEYKILQVNLLLDYAVVVLGSKFQAAHAALRHRKDSVASDSDIKITALGDEVNREIASFDLDVTYSDNYVT